MFLWYDFSSKQLQLHLRAGNNVFMFSLLNIDVTPQLPLHIPEVARSMQGEFF